MSQFVLRLHIRAYPLEFPSFEIPVDQYSEKLSPLGNFVYQKLPVKLCLNTVVGTYVNNVMHQFDIKIEKLYITRRPPPGTALSGLVLMAQAKKLKLANLCGYLLVTGDAWSNIDSASRSMILSVNYCRQDDKLWLGM